ncbi:fibronectin type III domain-containing protein [Pedosphaera parvula]|uniref:fibronectin type III domain-containing protein n=1 Tax=Pedosphaera parvula TaxID=1032527 RepID=UPI001ED964B3|nr:fibronectin type III domain-containing protein [Pedosphaera parvula]
MSATIQTAPPQITLVWPQDTSATPNSYTVYRKGLDDSAWGPGTLLPGISTNYIDGNVAYGQAYEYQIMKDASGYKGYGYAYVGIDAPLTESRGKLILVVDKTYATELESELAQLQQDMVGDGWVVVRQDVSRTNSVTTVKGLIQEQYDADPDNVQMVFLFGHVPVPYSGDIVPDGHPPNHKGAWPADVYYGDMDGSWTDNQINDAAADNSRNWNVPGDGKFDQSTMPAMVRLMVGRVDLANMPGKPSYDSPPTFPSELELLRNYLNKDHKFRHKLIDVPRRGLVGDYFGIHDGEAYAASGWRSFAPFFGAENIASLPDQGTWIPWLGNNQYLWAYGCGGGSFNSISGIGTQGQYDTGTTTDLVGADVKAVFTLLFGSWLGDWDSEDNIMRAVLATPSLGLTCAWSGRPHWFCHHMALGEPIGFSTRLTQNNGFTGLYQNQTNQDVAQIHIALMGDPTLRMHSVSPPGDLASTSDSSGVYLSWNSSSDSVVGYHVYRATDTNGPYLRVNDSLVMGNSYSDFNALAGTYSYMVRAVKLENTASGTYYNASQGIFSGVDSFSSGIPVVTISATAPYASRLAPTPGTFTLMRTGGLSADLAVAYTLSGTAQLWSDYQLSTGDMVGVIIIPAGSASVTLDVFPQSVWSPVEDRRLVIALNPDSNYQIGTPNQDTVFIAGNGVSNVSIHAYSDGIMLAWDSVVEGHYHVAYKMSLDDPYWTDMGVDVWANDSRANWFDSVPSDQQRFYCVFGFSSK